MTREETLEKMRNLISVVCSDEYSWEANKELWEIGSEWNSLHEDEEIFLSEYEHEDGRKGLALEDDYFLFEE